MLEELGIDQAIEEPRTRRGVEGPQTLRLLAGGPETGHLQVFAANAAEQVLVGGDVLGTVDGASYLLVARAIGWHDERELICDDQDSV